MTLTDRVGELEDRMDGYHCSLEERMDAFQAGMDSMKAEIHRVQNKEKNMSSGVTKK